MTMKRLMFLILSLAFVGGAFAQVYTNPYPTDTVKSAHKWVKSGVWRNGFTKASPAKQVNEVEFMRQYNRNPEQWQQLFRWLESTDLLAIPAGKHPIEGTSLVASVEDSENLPLEKRRSESHYRHIDFQYVVKGTEGFALIDHVTSRPNCLYDSKRDVIHYDYTQHKTIVSKPGKFNIFFPCDWHIAKVATKKKDQHLRVIVIKVDYKD